MVRQSTVDILNCILALHSRSLPQYLSSAHPWSTAHTSAAQRTLRSVAEDQRLMVERIGSAIMDEGGCPNLGAYPMTFTGMHDLSVDYLLQEAIQRQKQDIETLRQCIAQLQHAPAARALAEEALGAAEGHLQNLEELAPSGLSVASS